MTVFYGERLRKGCGHYRDVAVRYFIITHQTLIVSNEADAVCRQPTLKHKSPSAKFMSYMKRKRMLTLYEAELCKRLRGRATVRTVPSGLHQF